MNESEPSTVRPGYTDLDHRDVSPPYLRLAGFRQPGVFLWTLRIAPPNVAAISPATMHSLEHLLLAELGELEPGFVLAAPMGCMTGFYLITTCNDAERVSAALASACQAIQDRVSVPFADDVHCGAFRTHDLSAAKSVARWLLSRRAEWGNFGPAATIRAL